MPIRTWGFLAASGLLVWHFYCDAIGLHGVSTPNQRSHRTGNYLVATTLLMLNV